VTYTAKAVSTALCKNARHEILQVTQNYLHLVHFMVQHVPFYIVSNSWMSDEKLIENIWKEVVLA
jgi:hypothetical protein